MPAIPKSKRFAPRARNEYLFLTSVAAVNADGLPAPDVTELGASTRLTREIQEVQGFSTKTNFAQTGDAGNMYIGKIPVSAESDDSTITFYASEDGVDVRTILSQGQSGYMVIAPNWAEGALAEVYPVTVGSVSLPRDLNAPQYITVSFATPDPPNSEYEIPTGVTLPSYGA